jgi:hypothetical protein
MKANMILCGEFPTNTVRLHSRLAIATVVTAIVAATTAVLPSPASAAVSGLEIITMSSITDSVDSKSVTAPCPFGKVTIGSGAAIEGGLGQVAINDIRPTNTSVIATAYEDANGTNSQWSVQAQAICADPPSGHQIVSETSPVNSVEKAVTAMCPFGTVMIGSGAAIPGGSGDVEIDDLLPDAGSVTAIAYEINNGTPNNWRVKAYAICAYQDPLFNLEIVSASTADTSTNKNVTVPCSAGKEVLTAAGQITTFGQPGMVLLDDLFADVDSVTATGKETGNGTANVWRVLAIAVCGTP